MKIRNTYILLVTIIGLFTLALYSTYAMFTASIDTNEFVNLSASNLPTDTSMLEYERLTIEAGDSKIIDLNINNNTSNSLYYGVWYEMIEPSTKNDNIVIAKHINSSNETFGSIANSVSKKVTIIVNNKTSDSITINIGVAYSNTNSLNLPLNRELVTGEYGNFNVSISASNATIEGGTNLTNLLSNSSFENTGWSSCSYNNTYKKYGNYSCALTGTTSTPEVLAVNSTSISLNNSHKYYSRVEAYQTSKTGTQSWQTYWPIAEPSFGSVTFGDINKWNIYSLIADRNTFTSGSYQLRFDYDNRNNNGTVYYDGGMLIDLTESFGSGKEPTKEWLDSNISYFDGSLSTKNDVVKAGNNITYTIKPNNGYKLDKVTCDNGATASVNGNTVTVSNIQNDTKCYLNTEKIPKTSKEMLDSLHLRSNGDRGYPTTSETSNQGIFETQDDYGTSYYFRGAVTNNYVKFAGFYWRIVRIEGNGNVRLIYDGTVAHANGVSSEDKHIGRVAINTASNDTAYVGYMYGTPSSSTYATTHANVNSSNIKIFLEDWYSKILLSYNNVIATDTVFCNDRSLSSGTGIGTTTTNYAPYNRVVSSKRATLKCPQLNQDGMSVATATKGNKAITYPIGLITVDEEAYAGNGALSSTDNRSYYLYNGMAYWTMSPRQSGTSAQNNYISSSGKIGLDFVTDTECIRPVISLKASTNFIGTGTSSDPFIPILD